MTQFRYPQPSNEDSFEEFCLLFLRDLLGKPRLERYGHRGERQDGVDILDTSGVNPVVAAQCKHKRADKSISPAELRAEVEKARTFAIQIGEYYILTTGKRTTQAQIELLQINREQRDTCSFPINLLTWSDIERHLPRCKSACNFLGLRGPEADNETDDVSAEQLLDSGIRELTKSHPPSKRLVANYCTLEFDENLRRSEHQSLEAFCTENDRQLDVQLVLGGSGAGKTRLLIELARSLRARGWLAGFVSTHDIALAAKGSRDRLLIVDYAEATGSSLASALTDLRKNAKPGGGRIRAILLARHDGGWWRSLRVELPWLDDLCDLRLPVVLPELSQEDARRIFLAWQRILSHESHHDNEIREWSVTCKQPGIIGISALRKLGDAADLCEDPYGNLMLHEQRFWYRAARGLKLTPSDRLIRHVTIFSALNSISAEHASFETIRAALKLMMPEYDTQAFAATCDILVEVYGRGNYGLPLSLRPDSLAEYCAGRVLEQASPSIQQEVLRLIIESGAGSQAIHFLSRLAARGESWSDARG